MLTTYKQTDTNNVARVSLLRSGFCKGRDEPKSSGLSRV